MKNSETGYKVNEQGMILERINELEIDDVILSIQQVYKEIEELVFDKKERSPLLIENA